MPVISTINSELHLLEHSCRGTLQAQDIIDAFDAAMKQPEFERSMSVLWDLREAKIDATPEEMQALVTHVGLKRGHRGTGYRLAVVAQDTMLVMLADIFKALSSPLSFQVRIFRDIDEARSWISATN
ncbi:MAG: STAS/SEC14 domain-containing protein [Halobacteria archaeon]|nr:STAS/SEC14 domain-containing protein [Halobacteria archaeon]